MSRLSLVTAIRMAYHFWCTHELGRLRFRQAPPLPCGSGKHGWRRWKRTLRQESERLAENQLKQGVVLVSKHRQATAESYNTQADFLQAKLGYLLACAELEET